MIDYQLHSKIIKYVPLNVEHATYIISSNFEDITLKTSVAY